MRDLAKNRKRNHDCYVETLEMTRRRVKDKYKNQDKETKD